MPKKLVQSFNELKVAFNNEVDKVLKENTQKMFSELKEATPVDTGKAQASWRMVPLSKTRIAVKNSTEYIVYLNRGSSKQAPAYFIERTALKYGKPVGQIVYEK